MRIRNFIKEIVVYGIMFFISALMLSTFIYAQGDPADIMFYERERLVAKLEYMKSNKNSIDTVFIGSSMTERGVVPEVFDEQTGLQSFNLGSAGVRSFRALQIVDELIAADSNTLKYVFLEIQPHLQDTALNYKSNAAIFETRWSLIPVYIEGFSLKTGLNTKELYFDMARQLIYKYTGFGIKKQIKINLGLHTRDFYSELLYEKVSDSKGFNDLDSEVEIRNEFLSREDRGEFMMQRARFHDIELPEYIKTDAFTKKIISKINKLEEMGVKVFIIIPPRNNYLDYQLRQKHMYENNKITVIDLADYKEYPDFYFSDDFAYDPLHFNLAGAKKYTLELSKKFMTLANKTLVN